MRGERESLWERERDRERGGVESYCGDVISTDRLHQVSTHS